MRRLCAVLALTLAAPLFSAGLASATAAPSVGDVTALSVMPASGRVKVMISVSGDAKVTDFTLSNPERIVLDISPARLSAMPSYDKALRGGLRDVRFSQYDQNVVRVVLDMDRAREYAVSRSDSGVSVSVQSDTPEFAEWSSRGPVSAAAVAVPAVRAAIEPPVLPVLGAAEPFSTALQQAQRITISFNNDSIKAVIQNFADFTGRTILVNNENVKGLVTGTINDQPWDVALRELLDVNGFSMIVEPSGIIKIDTYENIASRQATERLATRTVNVNYTRAAALAGIVGGLLYKDCSAVRAGAAVMQQQQTGATMGMPTLQPGCIIRGSVMADTLVNKLVITEVASQMDALLEMIQQLDVRTPQVNIKAKIFLVNRTSISDIGISYDIGTADQFFNSKVQRIDPTTRTPVDINGDGVPDFLGGGTPFPSNTNIVSLGGDALSAVSNANNLVLNPALELIYSTALGKFDLTTFLDLLQETRLADVQAEPSVTTLDNHEARIFMGERTPIRSVQPQQGNTAVVQTTVQFEETGITLVVTPHVTSNRQVRMRLSAHRSTPEAGTSDIGLIFTKQESDNSLLVNDGETAVIGGITVSQISVSKVGIPILVDLPFIGKLFGQTTTRDEKRELLILVTPHIVDEGVGAPGGDR